MTRRREATTSVYEHASVRFVPLARKKACLDRHLSGVHSRYRHPGVREELLRTVCVYKGREFWVLTFADQLRTFVGTPDFFEKNLPAR